MSSKTTAALALAQASVDWANDTGGCHFCAYPIDGTEGSHDPSCPVEAFLAAAKDKLPSGDLVAIRCDCINKGRTVRTLWECGGRQWDDEIFHARKFRKFYSLDEAKEIVRKEKSGDVGMGDDSYRYAYVRVVSAREFAARELEKLPNHRGIVGWADVEARIKALRSGR